MLQDLINSLYEMIEDAKAIPLSSEKCIVDREKMRYLIEEIMRCLPEDIKSAQEIMDKRNHLIAEAKSQAEAVLNNAENSARKMVSQQEVVIQAQRDAKEIVLNAQTKSGEIKKVSTDFCDDSLRRAEEGIALILEDVKNTRRKFKGIK